MKNVGSAYLDPENMVGVDNSHSLPSLKQPKALIVLFLAEMWERFSYYGMRALLVLYVATELKWGDARAYGILGGYGTLLYLNNIAGGMIADRLLGFRKAVLIGGVLITLGHFTLAIPHSAALYLGLALVISGTGLFKGNITAFLGEFYTPNDPRRDNGYTIFYVGINIGGFLSYIACGYVAQKFGWHAAFSLAGFGMLLGLSAFVLGGRYLENKGRPPYPHRLTQRAAGIKLTHWLYAGLGVLTLLFSVLVRYNEFLKYPLIVVGAGTVIYSLYVAFVARPDYRANIICILVLTFAMMMFFSMWEQISTSVLLLTERFADRSLSSGWFGLREIPTTWFNSLNSIFVIVFGPIIALLWTWLGARRMEPYAPMKFVWTFALQGLSFLILWLVISANHVTNRMDFSWLVWFYLLQTLGELTLVPVGYSVIGKLSPDSMKGFFMGTWFMGWGFAQYIASGLAKLTSAESSNVGTTSISLYEGFYQSMTVLAFGFGAVLLIFSFFMRPVFRKLAQRS